MYQRQGGFGHRGRGPRGHRRDDRRIYEEVCDRLTDARDIDASEIEVEVKDGEVTLRGMVPDRAMRRGAELLAESVGGVTFVQNDLRTLPRGAQDMAVGMGTPVAAAYGLEASPSADDNRGQEPSAASADAGAGASTTSPDVTRQRKGAQTIAALFDSHADAERALQALVTAGTDREALSILRGDEVERTSDADQGQSEGGFLTALKGLFVPESEREAYAEGMRRGGAVLTAVVPEDQTSRVTALLRDQGAVDLDARRGEWRATGWREYEPSPGAMTAAGAT